MSEPTKREPGAGFALGQKVRITGTAVKRKEWSGFSRGALTYVEGPTPTRRYWTREGLVVEPYTEGAVVGYRTVQDGTAEYEDGAMFTPKEGTAQRVWLVAFDLRRTPVACFTHQVSALESKESNGG